MNFDMNVLIDKVVELSALYVPKLALTIVVLVVGLWIIGRIQRVLGKLMDTRSIDKTLQPFLLSIFSVLMKLMLLISVAGMVGIATTSFIAVLGAAGLAVGLALQGSLANFAGGALILIFRPYKVGDFIDAQGHMGTVQQVQIFNTILLTPDNRMIIIPNGPIAGGSITNFSAMPTRRVDWTFGIGYGDDTAKARQLILDELGEDSRVLKDPAVFVEIGELADSSVNFTVRAWVNAADFWGVKFDLIKNMKASFDANGINIPFPQRDVHLYKHDA